MKRPKTIQLNGKTYKVKGYAEDGLPIIQGKAETTQDGVDEHGNPKVSVNITVPPITVGLTPGRNG